MRSVFLVISGLFGLVFSSMFRDIVKGLVGSGERKISKVIEGLPRDYVKQIQNNEDEAGQFLCEILINHDVPGAIEDLGEDIWHEIEDDWSAVTEFVESLPTLAPQILENIVEDAEDVVSVVEEIITNPAAALTVIEGGVKTVISDIESVAGDVTSFFECLFGCASKHITSANPAATLSNSCYAVLAKASASTTSTVYSTYDPTTTVAAARTSSSTSSATKESIPLSISSRAPTATTQSPSAIVSTSSRTVAQSASPSSHVAADNSPQDGGTSGAIRVEYIGTYSVLIWAGLFIYFLIFVAGL